MTAICATARPAEPRRDPLTCPHLVRTTYEVKGGEVVCGLKGETFTNCHASIAGERPRCVWEPLDNTPEAVERRKAWMLENEVESQDAHEPTH